MSDMKGLDVTIMGREFRVACPAEEQDALMHAVEFLDGRMREIRDAGKIIGIDRIAIMAALNIAHEFLRTRAGDADLEIGAVRRRIKELQGSVDAVMHEQEQLF